MQTMYLRKEPYTDMVCGEPFERFQVCYYADKECTILKATNSNPSKPTKRNKYVMFNCMKYKVEWV